MFLDVLLSVHRRSEGGSVSRGVLTSSGGQWSVRILLECILVLSLQPFKYKLAYKISEAAI